MPFAIAIALIVASAVKGMAALYFLLEALGVVLSVV